MIKFKVVITFDNTDARWTLKPTADPGCEMPSDRDFIQLLRDIAGVLERNHSRKFN